MSETTSTLSNQLAAAQLAELEALREENALLKAALNHAVADAAAATQSLTEEGKKKEESSGGIGGTSNNTTNVALESHLEVNDEDIRLGIPSVASLPSAVNAGLESSAPGAGGMMPPMMGPPPCARYFGVGHLHRDEVERYSRQALLPHFGSQGCRDLISSSVLVVGAGGLGSTIIPYLAAAGVGHIRIVDLDTVDRSNLHRQIIHTDERVGVPKAISAEITANEINPSVRIDAVIERFDVFNASTLLEGIDVVLDATDNVASRYVINDACVFAGKPLVSGGATRWEGQITVYHYEKHQRHSSASNVAVDGGVGSVEPAVVGPCYRCLFPEPTPPSMVGNCNDVGVVGPVPGMIGCLQALEAIKVLLLLGEQYKLNSQRQNTSRVKSSDTTTTRPEGIDVMSGKMLMFDGLRGTYRTIKLRPRQPNCRVCGIDRKVNTIEEAFSSGEFPEYIPVGCNIALPFETAVVDPSLEELMSTTKKNSEGGVLGGDDGLAAQKMKKAVQKRMKETCVLDLSLVLPSVGTLAEMGECQEAVDLPVLLLDVRVPEQQNLCGIPGAMRMPLSAIEADPSAALARINSVIEERRQRRIQLILAAGGDTTKVLHDEKEDVYVLCRRGINSMKAVKLLGCELVKMDLDQGEEAASSGVGSVVNIQGGLGMWGSEIDSNFPLY